MPTNNMQRTKKTLSLSGLALMVLYVLVHVLQGNSNFQISRSASVKIPSDQGAKSAVSLADQCQRIGETFARSFWRHGNNSDPHWWCTQDSFDKSCRNDSQMRCSPKGLLYVKTPKTGSTTISRTVKRMVRSPREGVCQHLEHHVNGAGLWYANRDRNHSFLMASLRDPAQRAMSRFFWSYVTRHNNNNTKVDDNFIRNYLDTSTSVASGCTSKGQGGYQLNYISMTAIPEWSAWNPQTSPTQILHPQRVQALVQQTLQDYDFILLNERMDVSLVVLQFLLGLETRDMVSLSYNVGGSYRYEHGKCHQLAPTQISSEMQDYFVSDQWHAQNYGDYLLWAAVNQSLDRTIDDIGRHTFDTALQKFQRLQDKVNELCTKKVPFPCSSNGTVLFQNAKQAIPHDKIARCIDEVVGGGARQEEQQQPM